MGSAKIVQRSDVSFKVEIEVSYKDQCSKEKRQFRKP